MILKMRNKVPGVWIHERVNGGFLPAVVRAGSEWVV